MAQHEASVFKCQKLNGKLQVLIQTMEFLKTFQIFKFFGGKRGSSRVGLQWGRRVLGPRGEAPGRRRNFQDFLKLMKIYYLCEHFQIFHTKISMENLFFPHFLSHLSGLLSFYAPLEHTKLFGLLWGYFGTCPRLGEPVGSSFEGSGGLYNP